SFVVRAGREDSQSGHAKRRTSLCRLGVRHRPPRMAGVPRSQEHILGPGARRSCLTVLPPSADITPANAHTRVGASLLAIEKQKLCRIHRRQAGSYKHHVRVKNGDDEFKSAPSRAAQRGKGGGASGARAEDMLLRSRHSRHPWRSVAPAEPVQGCTLFGVSDTLTPLCGSPCGVSVLTINQLQWS